MNEQIVTMQLRVDGTRLQLPAVERVNGAQLRGELHPKLAMLAIQYDSSQTQYACELVLTIPQAQKMMAQIYRVLARGGLLPPPRAAK